MTTSTARRAQGLEDGGSGFYEQPRDDRYEVRRELGRGGMAAVYEVFDRATGRVVALKRLSGELDGDRRRDALHLFEREFHTLAQLAHPRIVEVYDYGVDSTGPYYTMELLDGGDLHRLAPLDPRRACALARDVCSALSLLHSRRFVHRDLSPRNVRCTAAGIAKVIDFGAMVPMGPNRHMLVGTPAYCAPELVYGQELDARTDLYALGATLFFTLVGRHAYPAKDFATLVDLWKISPPRPSTLVNDVPPALDALVMDLMQLDPQSRPGSAAEVLERLLAIEGRPADEHMAVAKAYLATPTLVGRESVLRRARARIARTERGRGGALLVEGPSGVGRSRFLDACMLEAKLTGAVVIRADGEDARAGDYGATRAFGRQLLRLLPKQTIDAARSEATVLAHGLPEVVAQIPGATTEPLVDSPELRPKLQKALRDWLIAIAREKPLVVAVDDLHRVDEPSLALLALLAQELRSIPLVIVASVESNAESTSKVAQQLFADTAKKITLENLTNADSRLLLASVFGEVPNLDTATDALFQVSSGNPRSIMQLAQHLLDRGLVKYEAGAWSLPARYDAGAMPDSMSGAYRARVEAIPADARELATAFSLSPGLHATLEECALLAGDANRTATFGMLDALMKADIVGQADDSYFLSRRSWQSVLEGMVSPESQKTLHARLATVYAARGNDGFREAAHWVRAGELDRGVELLSEHARQSQARTDPNPEAFIRYLNSLPADWLETYSEAIALCERLGKPRRLKFQLRSRLAGLLALGGSPDVSHMKELLAELYVDSGLADWAKLDPGLDPMARVMMSLGAAQARHAEREERDRLLDPGESLRQLARATIAGTAVVVTTLNMEYLYEMPDVSPFAPLSPALGVIAQLHEGVRARQAARFEDALTLYYALLKRVAEPDRAGLEESYARFASHGVMSGVGMIEAGLGLPSALGWADQLDADPLYRVNAMQVRMLHYLWQGDIRKSSQYERQAELLRIQTSGKQTFEGQHLLWQVAAHAVADDLVRIKQTREQVAPFAARYVGWQPASRYADAEYHRIRGDHAQALAVFEQVVSETSPDKFQLWALAAAGVVRTLNALGRFEEAEKRGREYLERAEANRSTFMAHHIRLPLALALARLGQADAAVATCDRVLSSYEKAGVTGLSLALAYETRARVALVVEDSAGFERYGALMGTALQESHNPALLGKLDKLRREAQKNGARSPHAPLEAAERAIATRVRTALDACVGPEARASRVLALVAEASGASAGYLFLLRSEKPELAAQLGSDEPTDSVRALAVSYLASQGADSATMMTDEDSALKALSTLCTTFGREVNRPVLLSHETHGGVCITGVVVLVASRGMSLVYPGSVTAEASRHLEAAGDTEGMIIR